MGPPRRRREIEHARAGLKQCHPLRRTTPDPFLRLRGWMALDWPTAARLWYRLKRPRLVFTPGCQAPLSLQGIGALDPLFLGSASLSWTTTRSCLRCRVALPVSHQVRFFGQLQPARCRVVPMVYVLIVARPSGVWRNLFCRVLNDHVAVPSCSQSGVRSTSARMRRCCASP
jgi:hypothetical protein